ncbi:MAG: APC family permease [Elusimicrobiaceae bacterium]|nr:APC family permease [Elusimicrobiaceae bacterium]
MIQDPLKTQFKVKGVVVITTAMLTFITAWQAASIVLCDFASSAFYAGGIAMRAFGPAFPWYILGVMLFAGLLMMMYIESCSMFTRGGVFPVVNAGLGENAAKAAAAAILFDFTLTGPISGLSAGHYLAGLINSILKAVYLPFEVPQDICAVVFALGVTLYFWYQNVKGIEDSSDKSRKIIRFSMVICLILFVWAGITLLLKDKIVLPPFKPQLNDTSLGWASNFTLMQKIGFLGVLVALGHSVLALSGLETFAQVFREIEYPKIQNLKKAALIVFLFALLFTGGLTFLSALIIPPDLIASEYHDNLLAGLAMHLAGPNFLKLIMQGAVVLAGVAMLAGAVNTSIIGANGIMNRVAETGILTDWFRKIHKKHGTTYHIINMICLMQVGVILLSGGKLYLIGQAYAFGVLWSFVLEMTSLVILRFKNREQKRDFMMPFNIKFDHYYIPIGGAFVVLAVVSLAVVNLFTKKVATISGISFAALLFLVFHISQRLNAKKANDIFEEGHREKLNQSKVEDLAKALQDIPEGKRILVPVKNPENLYHLEEVLKNITNDDTEIIVLYAKPVDAWSVGKTRQATSIDEEELFTKVILIAEKYGLSVHPLLVNCNDYSYAVAQVALAAKVKEIIMGVSGSFGANDQLERLVMAWGAVQQGQDSAEKTSITAKIVWEGREVSYKF